MRILTILTSGGFSLFQSKRSEIYFPYENFVKGGTAPPFLPNTMKIKLLIVHPALKLGVKLGLRAISSKIECACEREWEWILSMNMIQKDCCVEGKSWANTRILCRINPQNHQ